MDHFQEEFDLIRTAGDLLSEIDADAPVRPDRLQALIDKRKVRNPRLIFDIAANLEILLMQMDENVTHH